MYKWKDNAKKKNNIFHLKIFCAISFCSFCVDLLNLYLFYFFIHNSEISLQFALSLFFSHFLLLFKYHCLHFPPNTPPHPSHHHFPPLILPLFAYVHMSFIHVPWPPFLFFPHYCPPPLLWLLSVCS